MQEAGRLAGIARRHKPRAPMQAVQRVRVTREHGVEGDCRGVIRPGGKGRRQVSLIEAESWAAALSQTGAELPWHARRANLLIEGLRLPRRAGAIVAIGPDLRIETTVECDPCHRMDEIAPGLMAALAPDWRGGVLGRVVAEGEIAVGDAVCVMDDLRNEL